ncbi:hypothetical protein [Gephyromycinifex aptenodytis]|uniref:hypothetical protein n=1 Tax=Gephyromycinifex aptenodytis TaxID=2716227 RepID=UPI0014484E1E|nr:hypothetical protein [Gephyromycinifex aptenodytis]
MNVLSLHHAVYESELIDGKIVRQHQSHYLDFHVDGRPLRDWFDHPDSVITALNRPWLHMLDEGIAELTGRRPDPRLPAGRIPLLRCADCGDLGCGAITARLDITAQALTWSDFAWENDDDEPVPQHPGLDFVFDLDAYLRTIESCRARVAAFPYDPLAHHGRDFLWPWQWGWRLPRR